MLKFFFGDDGLVLPLHNDSVKLAAVLRPFLFEVVRRVFLPVFQLPAVKAVLQDMTDSGKMPQRLPHRCKVAVLFKPIVPYRVQIPIATDKDIAFPLRLRIQKLIDGFYRNHSIHTLFHVRFRRDTILQFLSMLFRISLPKSP